MKLRPHHLLCIQKFTGHGYDESFTKHITHLISVLPKGMEITLHEGCDDLCVACPFNKNGRCDSFDKVHKLDTDVLQTCDFSYGQTDDWKYFANLAKHKIIKTVAFEHICSKCQWYDLCQATNDEDAWVNKNI